MNAGVNENGSLSRPKLANSWSTDEEEEEEEEAAVYVLHDIVRRLYSLSLSSKYQYFVGRMSRQIRLHPYVKCGFLCANCHESHNQNKFLWTSPVLNLSKIG